MINENKEETRMLLDVAISEDRSVIKNETEKILKYKDLTVEIQRMSNVKNESDTTSTTNTTTMAHGSVGSYGKKSPVTPSGIDPETVRLVAQCLNHYATPGGCGVAAVTPPNQLQRCILTDYFNNCNFSKLK